MDWCGTRWTMCTRCSPCTSWCTPTGPGPSWPSSPAPSGGSWCCDDRASPATPWPWCRSRVPPAPFGWASARRSAISPPASRQPSSSPSSSERARSEESAVIGTVQAFALACGALFVSLYGGFLDSLTGLLFGTFLGISNGQVVALGAVAVVVLARPLFFATVDPYVAVARRVPVRALSIVFLVLLGCTAAEVSQITGALLVFALLVMPDAAAQQITARPAASFVVTIVVAVAITWLSLGVAFFSVYPVGFYVSTFGFAVYVAAAAGRASAKRQRRRPAPGPRPGPRMVVGA